MNKYLKVLKTLILTTYVFTSCTYKLGDTPSSNVTPECEWSGIIDVFYSDVKISYPWNQLSLYHQNQLGANSNYTDYSFKDVMFRQGDVPNNDYPSKLTVNAKITKGCIGTETRTYVSNSANIGVNSIKIPQPNVSGIGGEITVSFNTNLYNNTSGGIGGSYYYVLFEKTQQWDPFSNLNGTFVGVAKGFSFKSKSEADGYRKRLLLDEGVIYIDGDFQSI